MERLETGTVVDRRYVLKREIARGGAGTVFEAEHLFTKRAVALKLVTPGHANREACERLLREASVLTLARHPGVVSALDAGQAEDGTPYLVLELLEGRSLGGLLTARQRIGPAEAVTIGVQVCDALATAHGRGVVHRDVKPHNIFVTRDAAGHESVRLLDFGIAGVSGTGQNLPKLTMPGATLGTPEYMAPEQLLARDDVDARVDIYALGITLFECLTGAVPFEGSFGEVLLKVSTEKTPSVCSRVPSLPVELGRVIDRAIAREASERFADATAFGRALLDTAALLGQPEPLLGLPGTSGADKPTVASSKRARADALTAAATPAATRRRFARAPYITPVRIIRADKSVLDGRSEDISEGGLLVLTASACAQQEPVRVRFALPTTGKVIEVAATACWVRMARRSGAVGLEFSELPEDARSGIALYVKAMCGS